MEKRVICLICATVLVVMALFGVRTGAADWNGSPPQGSSIHLAKGLVKHAPNPLASAMFLVLGGVGIAMLFDKKNKH